MCDFQTHFVDNILNKSKLIFNTVKWFHAILSNTNNFIY